MTAPHFVKMRDEIRQCVFTKENCGNKAGNVTFWTDYFEGRVGGVLAINPPEAIKKNDPAERDRTLSNAKARGENYDVFGEK